MKRSTPRLVIVGPVTRDVIAGTRRPGGAACYASRVAAALGVRTGVLTVAGPDADLSPLDGHEVEVVPAAKTLTFEHELAGSERRLRVPAAPGRTLTAADLPSSWREARALLVAPLLPEDVDVASFLELPAAEKGLLAQGLQRRRATSDEITPLPRPSTALLEAASKVSAVFLSDEECANWSADDLDSLRARAARLVITRGADGAVLYEGGRETVIPPWPARPVDTTGAGDVFAAAFMLTLGEGTEVAGRVASAYAAASVEVAGPLSLPSRREVERRSPLPTGSRPR